MFTYFFHLYQSRYLVALLQIGSLIHNGHLVENRDLKSSESIFCLTKDFNDTIHNNYNQRIRSN